MVIKKKILNISRITRLLSVFFTTIVFWEMLFQSICICKIQDHAHLSAATLHGPAWIYYISDFLCQKMMLTNAVALKILLN